MLGRLLGETVELCTHLDPEVGHVRADPGQLEQLVMNLAVNARDAMPAGGRLIIRTCNAAITERDAGRHPELEPGRYACLCVADTGSGMTDEVKARIFEPFFTTKGLGKGTGLGLATVFGIVKQAGGSIVVETAVGRGTLMKVLLPALPPEPAAVAPMLLERAALPGHETILVAEDEEGVRRLATIALQAQGYTVIAVSSGSQALVASTEHDGPIHVLVTDLVMPDIGGRELAVRMRAMRPAIRVLYMSGYTDDAVVRSGVGHAADAFLPKPFTPQLLASKVSAVLSELPES
jgi:CheY-like chemotaxis protein